MSKKYRAMIYFVVATIHFYRKDLILPKTPVTKDDDQKTREKKYDSFRENNAEILKRVFDEGLSLFGYELSYNQVNTGIVAYLSPEQSTKDTPVATTDEETLNASW